MSKSRLNIELFKKIRDRIATVPESYDQSVWWLPSDKAPCGTTACLAGEAIICAAPTVEEGVAKLKRLYDKDQYHAVPERAAELLGLNGSWREFLDTDDIDAGGETIIFDSEAAYWPYRFAKQFVTESESEAAVAYLDHIIETGKILE